MFISLNIDIKCSEFSIDQISTVSIDMITQQAKTAAVEYELAVNEFIYEKSKKHIQFRHSPFSKN